MIASIHHKTLNSTLKVPVEKSLIQNLRKLEKPSELICAHLDCTCLASYFN